MKAGLGVQGASVSAGAQEFASAESSRQQTTRYTQNKIHYLHRHILDYQIAVL